MSEQSEAWTRELLLELDRRDAAAQSLKEQTEAGKQRIKALDERIKRLRGRIAGASVQPELSLGGLPRPPPPTPPPATPAADPPPRVGQLELD